MDYHWAKLEAATSLEIVTAFRKIGQLTAFAEFSDAGIWVAIQKKRGAQGAPPEKEEGLKAAEWEAFSNPDPAHNTQDFQLRAVAAPKGYEAFIECVVLVERLREVRALVGFTRIDSPGNFNDIHDLFLKGCGGLY